MMAAFLASHKLLPDLIVSSPAQRAKMTATFVAKERAFTGEMRLDMRIYLASAPMLMEVLRELPAAADRVLLTGHNPGMEDAGEMLCGGAMRMPTAAIASLRLHTDDWRDVRAGGATLQWLVKPKILR
jgi:phosphohistidine phosphatase